MAFTTCGKATRIVEYGDLSKVVRMSKFFWMLNQKLYISFMDNIIQKWIIG